MEQESKGEEERALLETAPDGEEETLDSITAGLRKRKGGKKQKKNMKVECDGDVCRLVPIDDNDNDADNEKEEEEVEKEEEE